MVLNGHLRDYYKEIKWKGIKMENNYPEGRGKLGAAIALAAEKFVGKNDKSGEPYILHCLEVMNNVKKWNDPELEMAAVLHDIIEDTNITRTDLSGIYGFSKRVCDIVSLVTFPPKCSDDEYMMRILKICDSQDAIKVKMADLEHNSLILRLKGINDKDMARVQKYHKAYYMLKAHLIR